MRFSAASLKFRWIDRILSFARASWRWPPQRKGRRRSSWSRTVIIENLALHQQLAVHKRTVPRPKLHTTDRLFWVALARVWAGWRHSLVIVTPDTVLRWQRRRFVSTGPNSPV